MAKNYENEPKTNSEDVENIKNIKNMGDSNESTNFLEKEEKKVIGKPFEKGNKFGKGRPPGSRNKATRALEDQLELYGYDPVAVMVKLSKKKFVTKEDRFKFDVAKFLADKMYANKKEVTSSHTEDKTITIQLGYAPMDGNILENAQREFGIIEGEVIEDEMCRLPKHDDDDES